MPLLNLDVPDSGLGTVLRDGGLIFNDTGLRKNVFSVTDVDPTVNDDSSLGFELGSRWANAGGGKLYTLMNDGPVGAADWLLENPAPPAVETVEYATPQDVLDPTVAPTTPKFLTDQSMSEIYDVIEYDSSVTSSATADMTAVGHGSLSYVIKLNGNNDFTLTVADLEAGKDRVIKVQIIKETTGTGDIIVSNNVLLPDPGSIPNVAGALMDFTIVRNHSGTGWITYGANIYDPSA